MRWIKNLSLGLVLISLVGSCLKQPEYSIVPEIKFLNFSSIRNSNGDSLIFVLHFQDGDGDLGINGNETAIYTSATDSTDIQESFYYLYDTVNKNNPSYITHNPNLDSSQIRQLGATYAYVDYKAKTSHRIDTLPDLSCKHYSYPNQIYFLDNPLHNNFFVNIFVKNTSTGNYEYLDPSLIYPFGQRCIHNNPLNGRFGVLSSDLGKKSPLDGTMTYGVSDQGFLEGKMVQFQVFIFDRAFHRSNTVTIDHNF